MATQTTPPELPPVPPGAPLPPTGMARWSTGVDGQRRIVAGLTPSQWMAAIAILTGGGTGYASLSSTEYVDKGDAAIVAQVKAVETAQEALGRDVSEIKGTLDIIVRLNTAQHAREERRMDAEVWKREARAARRRRQPEPPAPRVGPAARTAKRMQVDPDDPLHGLKF